MANELQVAKLWLYATLHGDADLLAAAPGDVWQDLADERASYPVVVFVHMGGSDMSVVNGIRVWSNQLWLVKVIVKVGESSPTVAVGRIDALLHRATGTAGTGRVLWSERERPFTQSYASDGIQYREEGGFYHLLVQDPDS